MITVKAKEARIKFSDLLTEAEHGETISITRRGHEVARIVPPEHEKRKGFPDLSEFRKKIKLKSGKIDAVKLVRDMRDEERY